MSSPVLTKKQQKQCLSAKKGPIKGLRNVLAQPQDTYWPVVNEEDESTLNFVLKEFLPVLKRPLVKQNRKKKDCPELKEASKISEETLPNKDILNSVVLGSNSVTRCLEKNMVCCVLLDANVEPPFLIKHIVIMAQNKKLPVLLISSLKVLTLETIGFRSTALAFKNTVLSSDHHFHTLYNNVSCISKNYLPSKQSFQLYLPSETLDCTITEDSKMDDSVLTEDILNIDYSVSSVENVYKLRSSRKERIFIPPNAIQNLPTQEEEADFLSIDNGINFNDDDTPSLRTMRYFNPLSEKNKESKRQHYLSNNTTKPSNISENPITEDVKNRKSTENDVKYLPLKIKRLRGNSNRIKATKVSKKKRKNQHK